MKPYYEHAGITIYHGDFREGLEHLGSCDCIIADPPYGETSLAWDVWPDRWPDALAGAVKSTASLWCFGSARMFLAKSRELSAWRFVQDVVWEKQNGTGFINDRFKRVHESAYQFILSGAKWADVFKAPQFSQDAVKRQIRRKQRPPHMGPIGTGHYLSDDGGLKLVRSVVFAKNCHGKAQNETQKPDDLVGLLARYSCPAGGLIGSPFMGSGTDLVVAKAHGMRAVGFDVREEQCEIAAKRLAQENLFGELAAA